MLNYQRVNHHDPSVAAKAGEAYAAPGVSPGLASGWGNIFPELPQGKLR